MMSNGAIHGHVPERRAKPRPAPVRVNVPPGFKLVPDKATPEWVDAVCKGARHCVIRDWAEQSIATVLEHAPVPPDSLAGFYDGPLGTTYAEPVDDSSIVRIAVPDSFYPKGDDK
jgi:hypothetical protein